MVLTWGWLHCLLVERGYCHLSCSVKKGSLLEKSQHAPSHRAVWSSPLTPLLSLLTKSHCRGHLCISHLIIPLPCVFPQQTLGQQGFGSVTGRCL